ncbi:hypothetical protein KOI35_26650 [Actinoplanes bogorensis]|uniref:Uncharacterized protein n=1 Tax=Paractinoplanes bogorensis TaxID=1610840 RepID=A0ABS5YUG7_9ACTN|nr:hypothetical protein [Actinoplanes bogorensis]MBU2667092.1 hypothetical protein [Actinoplanes bogorensis]
MVSFHRFRFPGPLLQALRWTAGQRLDMAVLGDALVITGSPTGRHPVGVRGEIAVPEAVRALLPGSTPIRG